MGSVSQCNDNEQSFAGLTDDELNCLRQIALGQSMKAIDEIRISGGERTDHLLDSAMRKLGAKNLFNALTLATLAGLLGDDVVPSRPAADDADPASPGQ